MSMGTVSEGSPVRLSAADILGRLNDVEVKHAPEVVFAAGDLGLLKLGPRVSIVGSRQASPEGLKRAASLARALVQRDIVVVSGLAEGIDTAAHRAAIEAGGKTIAVIGTPLDQTYPKENSALQAQMMREQLVLSQFAPGTKIGRHSFPLRNRTMALLTDATVIVEASEKSGTLHQGWEALRLGRLLYLMESVAKDPKLTWPKEMIHYGAQVLTRENLEESFAEIPAVTTFRDDLLRHIA
jgi:DNA processing protein